MPSMRGPDERRAVTAVTLAAAALIAQQVAGKATRDALFLSNFPIASLPVAMVVSAVVSATAVLGFSAALSRRSPARVVPGVLAVGTLLLLAEWGLSLVQPRVAAAAVYLHMAAFGATVVSGFFSLVSERFDPYTARRAMGGIGLGASLGGVGGGLLAWSTARILPVSAVLAVMAALNVASLIALGSLRASPSRGATGGAREAEAGPLHGLRLLREVPYLRDLGLVVALGAGMETLLDYIVSARAVASFGRGEPLMQFFALFYTGVGLLALAVQTLLSRPALRRLGLAGTVTLRPAAVAVSALFAFVDPRLASAVFARGAHGVLHNSLFRSGYELLFTPLPSRRKRPTKTIIDVGFDKLGSMLAGLLALLVVSVPGESGPRILLGLAVAGGVAAVLVSRRLHHGYVAALEESLRSGVIRLDASDVVDSTTLMTLARTGVVGDQEAAALLELAARRRARAEEGAPAGADPVLQMVADLRAKDAEVVRRPLRREEAVDPALVGHLVPLVARNDVFLDVLRVLRRLAPRVTGQLLDALLDPGQPVAVRRRIARVLRGCPTPRAADGLVQALRDPQFEVRRECALTLSRITEREPLIVIPKDVVFAAAVRELKEGAAGWRGDPVPASSDGGTPELRAQTPAERGLTHVFTLLALALERQPLQTALVALTSGDPALRGTALEYLRTTLPEDVRRALWPHVGAKPEVPAAPSVNPRG